MTDYSNYFDFGTGPSIQNYQAPNENFGWSLGGGIYDGRQSLTRQRVDQGTQDKKAAKAFNEKMAGLDAKSQAYIDQLSAIYNGYGQYAQEYGDKARPIIDALTGDIEGFKGYMDKYSGVLNDIAPTMMNGIKVDPNATRTREQYTGNVLSSFANARQKLRADAASQGQNAYANTGANRALALSEAASLTDAGNKAYSDWRTQYNNDMRAKQAALGQYADLTSRQVGMQDSLIKNRSGLLGAEESVFKARTSAQQAQQAGLSDLLGLNESRRQEQLALGQQAQNNARTNADITQQLEAKIPSRLR